MAEDTKAKEEAAKRAKEAAEKQQAEQDKAKADREQQAKANEAKQAAQQKATAAGGQATVGGAAFGSMERPDPGAPVKDPRLPPGSPVASVGDASFDSSHPLSPNYDPDSPGAKRAAKMREAVSHHYGLYDELIGATDLMPGEECWAILNDAGEITAVQRDDPPFDVPCCRVRVNNVADARFDGLVSVSGATLTPPLVPRPEIRVPEVATEDRISKADERRDRMKAVEQEMNETGNSSSGPRHSTMPGPRVADHGPAIEQPARIK